MDEIKKYQNWPGLVEYTKEFKEWVWKLFRKVHARIGHVEEEIAKIKKSVVSKYTIKKTVEDNKIIYGLYETTTETGPIGDRIIIDPSTGVQLVEWIDLNFD